MMGIETELVAVLQDLVEFLENLSDVNLPHGLDNVRESLLRRSRTSLVAVGQRSTTPEPYLDMNAGKGKGLHSMEKIDENNVNNGNQTTEYMYADNSIQSRLSLCQDYYETFSANAAQDSGKNMIESQSTKIEQEIISIYKTFSYDQMLNKAIKSGPLNLKEERRLFRFQLFSGFDQFRPCFIGLVGSHLLLYATKHDKHPHEIISLRGYSARASPNSIPRDLERSKSAFEIFSPGNRTFQFAARSPKEMEQWVAIICRAESNPPTFENARSIMTNAVTMIDTNKAGVLAQQFTCPEEQYQDVGHINDGTKSQSSIFIVSNTKNDIENDVILRNKEEFSSCVLSAGSVAPPPLPARIPRRLPSLPQESQSPKLSSIDDVYDEDDIYHKIEDVKQLVSPYQNLTSANYIREIENNEEGSKCEVKKLAMKKTTENYQAHSLPGALYDDAQPMELSKVHQSENEQESMTYDDIYTIVDDDARKEIVKERRKKSFLDRVRYKKETSKKENARKKLKQHKLNLDKGSVKSQSKHVLTPYDDVFSLELHTSKNHAENLGDYTSPPAPRAIYDKPVSFIALDNHDKEDFYDDIGVIQNNRDNRFTNNLSQVSRSKSSDLINYDNSLQLVLDLPQRISSATLNCPEESEHYQVPRSQDLIDIGGQVKVVEPIVEELYDDIAIVANFRARQQNSACSNSSSNDKISNATCNVTRVWNRFASGRKLKINDLLLENRGDKYNSDECYNTPTMRFDSNEEIDGSKMNKLQKLINKMELIGLSKSKPISPMINKPHGDNLN